MSSTRIDKCKIGSNERSQNGPPEDGDWITTDQFANESVLTGFQHSDNVRLHEVEVFLAEFIRLVLDLAGIMSNDEGSLALLRHFVIFVFLVD